MTAFKRATKPSYHELEERVRRLETENKFLKEWNDYLSKEVEQLIKFQPPPPIILTTTTEKIDEIRRWNERAEPGAEG